MPQEQWLKPATAARKLGVLLEATPAEFQQEPVSRSRMLELQADPPAWLVDLRRDGPHPRGVVAARLGVSTSGLRRGGFDRPLTTAEIRGLLADEPDWLVRERETRAAVLREDARVQAARAGA